MILGNYVPDYASIFSNFNLSEAYWIVFKSHLRTIELSFITHSTVEQQFIYDLL